MTGNKILDIKCQKEGNKMKVNAIKIDGYVEIGETEKSDNPVEYGFDFNLEFIKWIESKGWSFGGTIKAVNINKKHSI